jgi:hypothetical protein
VDAQPLYAHGHRRPGPNKFGFDLTAPVLAPAKRVEFAKPPPDPIRRAVDYLTDTDTWKNRKHQLGRLRMRRRRGPDGKMVTYTPGLSADDAADKELRTPQAQRRAAAQAFLACVVEHADVKKGLAGDWRSYVDTKGVTRRLFVGPFTRHQWADKAGVSLTQFDELMSDCKAAEYIDRRQRRKEELDAQGNVIGYAGQVASLLLNEKFWFDCGPEVWRAYQKYCGIGPFKKKPPAPPAPTPPPSVTQPREETATERQRRLDSWRRGDEDPPP